MGSLVDEADQEQVTEVGAVYGEAVDVYEDPLSSFDAFEGHNAVKNEVRSKVLDRLSLGSYAPSLLLLLIRFKLIS